MIGDAMTGAERIAAAFPVQKRSLAEADPSPRPCRLPGCDQPVRPGPLTGFCSIEHANEANRRTMRQIRARPAAAQQPDPPSRPPPVSAAAGAEWRQKPVRLPYRLITDPSVKILPPLPAKLRVFTNGLPTPFQDDLRAQRDKGSPGTQAGLEREIAWPRQSALA